MSKHGKKYESAAKKVDENTRYSLSDSCKIVKDLSVAKFDESIDLAINLGVDPRHADQMLRSAILLPHGSGKKMRVAVFAKGDKATEAKDAGADVVGAEDLAEIVEKGKLDVDKIVASPDMMAIVGKLGRVLGPKGLMPNPKVGTVTPDVAKAVLEIKKGKVEFKTDKNGVIHVPVGRASFSQENLLANVKTLLQTILRMKPASLKGQYVKKITLSPTMGPSVKLDIAQSLSEAEKA